jgi:urease accessory protein
MHSDVLIVARQDRQPWIECAGGLAARTTEPDTVHLVSTAATPLGGDTIALRVVVERGARLRLCSAAATVTLPGRSTAESTAHWHLEVAGDLDVDTQPTVVAGGSRHATATRLSIDGSGRVRLRERVQIGRTDERQGFWSGSLHADVDGQPLLRHRIELGAESATHDLLGKPLASVSELRYPDTAANALGAVLQLADGGSLATWQGDRLEAS